MKLFRRIGRNIRDSFRSIFRNFSLSIASISCITITLIVVSLSMILTYNVNNFAASIKKDVTVVVFLDNNTTSEQAKEVENNIKRIGNIASITFKSKQDSAKEAMEENSIFESIMANWDSDTNPLLDSYLIKVNDIDELKSTATKIKKLEHVYSVSYGEDMVDQLITVFKVIQKVSVVMVGALILVTAFLITNTIKLTIFSRKTEIEIMRLVGASNSAIKVPFIIEGLLLGVLGSIIPIGLSIYGYTALYNFFEGRLFGSALAKLVEPTPFVYYLSLVLVLIGMLVGMVGSARASRKYLKI